MSYTCDGCGESFGTLSRKRLHDCPTGVKYGGDEPTDQWDTTDDDVDEIVEKAVGELLICDVCGAKVDEVDGLDEHTTDRGLAFAVHFDCPECGARNDNSATMGP